MGQNKPRPRRLALQQSDIVKYGLNSSTFTKATFNNGTKVHDTYIVTSTGNFVVTWRLKDVRKGNLGKYDIKQKKSKVVCSQFKFDGVDEVIVTMPEKISLEKKIRMH